MKKQAASTSSEDFGLPDSFWEWIRGDQTLKTALDRMIDTQVEEKVKKDFEKYKGEVFSEAKKEGIQKGIDLSQAELGTIKNEMKVLVDALSQEKELLLRHHANLWVGLFESTLKLFLREAPQLTVSRLNQFFDQKISEFHIEGKLEVECSVEMHQHFSKVISPRVVLVASESCQGTHFKVKWADGYLVFDEQKALEDISQIIRETIANAGDASP